MSAVAPASSSLEELAATLWVLRRHNEAMRFARYDYGAGQRARELRRVEGLYRERCYWHRPLVDAGTVLDELEPELLLRTFERIAVPRMRRMSPSRRGPWLRVLYDVAAAGAELVPDRAMIEEENGYPIDRDTAVELWTGRKGVR